MRDTVYRCSSTSFAASSTLGAGAATANATATRNSNLWILYKADLDELVSIHPTIGSPIAESVLNRKASTSQVIHRGITAMSPVKRNRRRVGL